MYNVLSLQMQYLFTHSFHKYLHSILHELVPGSLRYDGEAKENMEEFQLRVKGMS